MRNSDAIKLIIRFSLVMVCIYFSVGFITNENGILSESFKKYDIQSDLSKKESQITYVTEKKETIEDITKVYLEEESISNEGNSFLGKFFISDTEKVTKRKLRDIKLYYFVNTENGLLKKNLAETIPSNKEDVFFKEISKDKKPFIETKIVKFTQKDKEEERKKFDVNRKIYVLNFPKEELQELKELEF
ncbi:TPA: hypothetical protein ACQJHO_000813 [Enterococcus faecium]